MFIKKKKGGKEHLMEAVCWGFHLFKHPSLHILSHQTRLVGLILQAPDHVPWWTKRWRDLCPVLRALPV